MDDIRAQIYQSLDTARLEIRVIEILSDEPDKPVACQLHTISLKVRYPFVALSYLWRDPSDTVNIHLNGFLFPVTRNLESALRHVKRVADSTPGFRLWVDALCINQQDLQERNNQVQNIMRSVYEKAVMVFCWLGPSDEVILRGFRTVEAIFEAAKTNNTRTTKLKDGLARAIFEFQVKRGHLPRTDSKLFSNADRLSKAWIKQCSNLLKDKTALSSMQHLASLPYWQRIWVFQELVLPKYVFVICGFDCIGFGAILGVVCVLELIKKEYTSVRPPFVDQETWSMLKNGLLPANSVLTLIMGHRLDRQKEAQETVGIKHDAWKTQLGANRFNATDPKDFVYGLQGLFERDMPVDYSLPVVVVYQNMIRACLVDMPGNLTFLGIAGSGYADLPRDWPSWVPGFHFRSTDMQVGNSIYQIASNDPCATISEDNSILNVHGIFVEVISILHPTFCFLPTSPIDSSNEDCSNWDWNHIAEQNRPFILFMRAFVAEHGRSFCSKSPLEVLVRTLFRDDWPTIRTFICADYLDFLILCLAAEAGNPCDEDWGIDWTLIGVHNCTNAASIAKQMFKKSHCERAAWQLAKKTLSILLTNPRVCISEAVARYRRKGAISHHLATNKTHRLFETESGAFGAAPPHSQPGDMLCILRGCAVPALLRPKGDASGHFEFVGLCWVNGIHMEDMDRVFQKHKSSIRNFRLR